MKTFFNKEGRNEGISKGELPADGPSALLLKILFLPFLLSSFIISAPALTPFYLSIPGQTNPVVMQAYPVGNTWTVYGTNIIYGGPVTNVPNTSGFFSNALSPNQYRALVPALGTAFYVILPDTTNYYSLALYVTNVPSYANPLTTYGIITNMLGYAPVQPTSAAVITALGYTPPTNTYSALTNVLGFGVATNSNPALSNALATTFALYPLATPAGIATALGGYALTNNDTRAIALLGSLKLTNRAAAFTNGSLVLYSSTNTIPFYDSNFVFRATTTNDPFALYRLTNTATAGGTNWQKVF